MTIYTRKKRIPYGGEMDIGKVLNDSLEYAKDAVWGKWVRWVLLLVSTIIFPLIMGYLAGDAPGKETGPRTRGLGQALHRRAEIPRDRHYLCDPHPYRGDHLHRSAAFTYFSSGVMGAHTGLLASGGLFAIGILLAIIVTFIVGLIEVSGIVRFARMGSMGEAFNFNAILAQIGKIGWGSYILSLIVLAIVLGDHRFILLLIPVVGWFIAFVVTPPLAIFAFRFIALLYDSAPQAAA